MMSTTDPLGEYAYFRSGRRGLTVSNDLKWVYYDLRGSLYWNLLGSRASLVTSLHAGVTNE